MLAESPNVAAIIAGHRHINAIEKIDAGPNHITQVLTSALFRSVDDWRRFRLTEDSIEVSETGKPDSIAITIPAANLVPAR